jgi:protein-S-isoprenylcysteine O-methyltransferase Ste14
MNRNLADKILLANPVHISGVEGALLFVTGILGWALSWPKMPFFPILNVAGGVLALSAMAFHFYSEKAHSQSHCQSGEITNIAKTGVYSKIRHPLYLSLIGLDLGIGLALGILWTFLIAILITARITMTALKEEKFLLERFPEEYGQYLQKVKWRMIPGLF